MRIKKFEARDMREALKLIKQDLGPEAVILKSEKLKKKGSWGGEILEVVAAVDVEDSSDMPAIDPILQEPGSSEKKNFSPLFLQEDELEKPVVSAPPTSVEYVSFQFHENEKIRYFQKILYKNEINPWQIIKLAREVEDEFPLANDIPELAEAFKEVLKRQVFVSGQLMLRKSRATVIALIGPTGVGKTTTIAKLAANFSIYGKLNIGLITADTYRVAAIEQLKTYAQLTHLAIRVAYTPEEMAEAVTDFHDKHLIFIDTAGSCQKNREQIAELAAFIETARVDETHLVLSATSKFNDNLDVIRRFGVIPIHRLIFSKLDETESVGMIFNIQQRISKPISYFTTGQNVPEDIELANENFLVENILGEHYVATSRET